MSLSLISNSFSSAARGAKSTLSAHHLPIISRSEHVRRHQKKFQPEARHVQSRSAKYILLCSQVYSVGEQWGWLQAEKQREGCAGIALPALHVACPRIYLAVATQMGTEKREKVVVRK